MKTIFYSLSRNLHLIDRENAASQIATVCILGTIAYWHRLLGLIIKIYLFHEEELDECVEYGSHHIRRYLPGFTSEVLPKQDI